MSGWADIVEGLELRYKAVGQISVKGKRMRNDGTVEDDKDLTGNAVLSYLKRYREGQL